jgi:hypothetical protein
MCKTPRGVHALARRLTWPQNPENLTSDTFAGRSRRVRQWHRCQQRARHGVFEFGERVRSGDGNDLSIAIGRVTSHSSRCSSARKLDRRRMAERRTRPRRVWSIARQTAPAGHNRASRTTRPDFGHFMRLTVGHEIVALLIYGGKQQQR